MATNGKGKPVKKDDVMPGFFEYTRGGIRLDKPEKGGKATTTAKKSSTKKK